MSNDWQMAKQQEDGVINLAVGEPYFLQDAISSVLNTDILYHSNDLTYPSFGGQKVLIDELRSFHEGKQIIIANGGKQGLLAAMYAMQHAYRKTRLVTSAPHWPSFPTLADLNCLAFNAANNRIADHSSSKSDINLVVCPNNPDGDLSFDNDVTYDIADMAYAHPVYGYSGCMPKSQMYVWSASKVLGLSGFRVGWVTTDNPELANLARYYMEITTSGVSSISQFAAASFLKELRLFPEHSEQIYRIARETLLCNGQTFMEKVSRFCSDVRGFPTSGTGMFAFFKVVNGDIFTDALHDAKIKVVNGEACGISEPGWFRMSMGHSRDVTLEALSRLEMSIESLGKI